MILQVHSDLALEIGERRATLRYLGGPVRSWPVVSIGSLSTRQAADLGGGDALLLIERAAPSALAVLREAGVSYVTHAGEWHLVEPPELFVVKPADRRPPIAPSPTRPLGKGAARIARWLVLHPQGEPATITDLARECQVSEATSSRSVRQLAERDLVAVATAPDARRRSVTVGDRAALLDTVTEESAWRHARKTTWDVGAHSLEETLSLIRQAAAAEGLGRYAIGELAGAAMVRRVVEPATVVLWLPGHDVAAWQDALVAEPARPAPGRVAVRLAPDPVVLAWGPEIDGLRVADPVQLYIDCCHAGERAIDAAEALRDRLLQP